MKRHFTLLNGLFLFSFLVAAIPAHSQPARLPIRLSVFSESTSIPFVDGFITRPIHPGVSLGTEWALKRLPKSRLIQGLSAGYYYHQSLTQGFFLSTDIRYEVRLPLSLYASLGVGVGYLHTFRTGNEFRLEDGQYVLKKDNGNSHAMLSLPLELGIRLGRNGLESSKLFVQYQPWVEYPFSPGFIPLMTHTNLVVGCTFFPFH
ncbi:hypothetical protein IC229_33050 [Spirosoma sp. BT702]|uniref:Outer membrane protein beta-barrel domain-containing protein n=1 Tax=Spirosoma profusum TaxID=2771354 RepID=A0A927GAE0_9BACT|nr:hypothetical protein [Spirosoma profusum]MBD2705486.1 hypothetical protein [Spirosoma profusum]